MVAGRPNAAMNPCLQNASPPTPSTLPGSGLSCPAHATATDLRRRLRRKWTRGPKTKGPRTGGPGDYQKDQAWPNPIKKRTRLRPRQQNGVTLPGATYRCRQWFKLEARLVGGRMAPTPFQPLSPIPQTKIKGQNQMWIQKTTM